MREFNIIPHGAGKNFLGAIQDVIKGVETVKNVEKQIKINNLFDGIYLPFHFNNNWYDRTDWNKELLECQRIWRQYLEKTWEQQSAKKEIIDRLNICYKGTFHINHSLPSISRYGIICVIDSSEQRAELDRLAIIKKRDSAYKNKIIWEKTFPINEKERIKETDLIHSWEIQNIASYKADYAYDYTGLFYELDPKIINEIIKRTEETFKVKSSVENDVIKRLIAKYHRRNHQILLEDEIAEAR